jgi:hypothetical protein
VCILIGAGDTSTGAVVPILYIPAPNSSAARLCAVQTTEKLSAKGSRDRERSEGEAVSAQPCTLFLSSGGKGYSIVFSVQRAPPAVEYISINISK